MIIASATADIDQDDPVTTTFPVGSGCEKALGPVRKTDAPSPEHRSTEDGSERGTHDLEDATDVRDP